MKNVVMGTAGHIDHGKTALVKRLTGIDTDRLEEEKRRGMTIELGFAPLTLPSGNSVSIIDVPGHEKFVKTMVAGVTGIDFVMLVIAADEGVMPQTREHLDILSLLNVRAGVVALTKTDLVDEEWLDMVKSDVRKELNRTALANAPVIPVSSVTGYGIDKLIDMLEQLAEAASSANAGELFRLPVDRVFTMSGHGTVVTGTISGGKVSKGDVIEIAPSGLTARVRGIQVHNRNVDNASAGNRCALNLSGIEKSDIKKGDVAAGPGVIKPARIVDAVLYVVEGKDSISHNQRVHVHTGTREVLARIRTLGVEEIPAAGKGYIQLRFEEPVAILRGDRFIIRSYSPVTTLGGGWIIFHSAQNRQRFSEESIEALTIGEQGSLNELAEIILKKSGKLLSTEDLWKELLEDREEILKVLTEAVSEGKIVWLKETNKYLDNNLYSEYIKKINAEFELLYKKYPYRYQLDREEIKSRVFGEFDSKDFAALLNNFIESGIFETDKNFVLQKGRSAINRIYGMKETAGVEKAIFDDGLSPRSIQQLKQSLGIETGKIEEIGKFLVQIGKIIDLDNGILIHKEVFKNSVEKVRSILDKQGSATAAQVRDYLNVGRKTAIALLEYLDSIGVTERVDDLRKPGVHYMDYYI